MFSSNNQKAAVSLRVGGRVRKRTGKEVMCDYILIKILIIKRRRTKENRREIYMPGEFSKSRCLTVESEQSRPRKTVQRTTKTWKQTFTKGYRRETQGHRDGSAS